MIAVGAIGRIGLIGSGDRGSPEGWPTWADLPKGGPIHSWDMLTNEAWFDYKYRGALANTPGWTFTRASTGYAQNAAGVLQSFASGELRRTDKGVLIEGARTNLCIRSQELDDAAWTKTACSVTANATTAPDGTATADLLVEDGTTAQRYAQGTSLGAYTVAATICGSIYFKQGVGSRNAAIRFTGASGSAYVVFNPSDGSVVTSTATGSNWTVAVTPVAAVALGNGWYRGYLVAGHTETSGTLSIRATLVSGSTLSYLGDSASGVYFWGAQAEAASFPSSYIPTTTASVARAADVLSITGVTGLSYPLSIFGEFERSVDTGTTEAILDVSAGATTDEAYLQVGSTDLANGIVNATTQQMNTTVTGALSVGTTYKAGVRVATNDGIVAKGGALSAQDTSLTLPVNPTAVRFGARVNDTSPSFGYLRRAAIWNRALSDAELQAVTT